ncbi:amidohydrolase family protein [Stetteria hydrogenophila]
MLDRVELVVEGRLLDGREARIFLGGGVVLAVRGPAAPVGGARVYRAPPGTVVGPAFVDIHVHLRGLELSFKEDERSGTAAAAAGGVAAVVDMPNTRPPLRDPGSLGLKAESLARLSLVDYAVWAGIPRDPGHAPAMAGHPLVLGFKAYPEDYDSPGLAAAAAEASRLGKALIVHPEDPGLIGECSLGRRGSECRPPEAEVEAVHRIASLAPPGLRVHVTHATTPATLEAAASYGFTSDVTPHHLTFTSRDEARGCLFKVNPPLRPPEVVEGLVKAVSTGLADAVASDHAPHTPGEKSGAPEECPPGIPGLEYAARVLLTLASRGVLSLASAWRLYSARPALAAGLRGYGCLAPGCRAAVAVVDPSREGVIGRTTRDYSKAGPGAWEGYRYRGEPVALILGGSVVMEDGEVHEDAAAREARPATALTLGRQAEA